MTGMSFFRSAQVSTAVALRQFARSSSTSSTSSTICAVPSTSVPRPPIVWTHLPGHIPYHLGLLLQETLVANRHAAKKLLSDEPSSSSSRSLSASQLALAKRTAETDILLLLEHKPVFTAGRREKDPEVTKAEGERLRAFGADYVMTMRGGQTTYHGPGQLVGYSLMDLAAADLTTRCYVAHFETFLENLTTSLNVPFIPLDHTGVFTSPTAKIGSIGIHIRRRISLHGFSLNIDDQPLYWFNKIVACGLDDVKATSAESELRRLGLEREEGTWKVEEVIPLAVREFGRKYGRDMEELGSREEHNELVDVVERGVAGKLPPLVIKE